MRLAEPSTSVPKVSAGFRRLLGPATTAASTGAMSGISDSTCSCTVRAAGVERIGPSRGASTNSRKTGVPWMLSSKAVMRAAYCARIQSILKRLATCSVTLEASGATLAASGRIQVLNCCSGMSCASRSTQVCHRSAAAGGVRSSGMPSIMLGKREKVLWTNDRGLRRHCSARGHLSTRRAGPGAGPGAAAGQGREVYAENRVCWLSACPVLDFGAIIAGFPLT